MSSVQQSTFVITREDREEGAKIIVSEGLTIGRGPDSDIWLNHPTVTRLHAGINEVERQFYVINLSASSATTLNGRVIPFNEVAALAAGDEIQIGLYQLEIEEIEKAAGKVVIKVVPQSTPIAGGRKPRHEAQSYPTDSEGMYGSAGSSEETNALKVFWGKRTREKIARRSLLQPRASGRMGKAQFNWTPTRDLAPAWPRPIITWTLLAVALVLLVAAPRFPQFFSSLNARAGGGSYATGDLQYGRLPYRLLLYGTGGALLILAAFATARAVRESVRLRRSLMEPAREKLVDLEDSRVRLSKELSEKYDPGGPDYPHPVIIAERCIGCHACVDACPHDVLAMVDNLAVPVASDQCMEDMGCQIACPVSPKACIVVNTLKTIKPPPAPQRDSRFMTNVPGCYVIGDVSGTPLIKNAVNEGAIAMNDITSKVSQGGPPRSERELDVAIIGAGPAGLSAAIMAKQGGLKYVLLEQDRVLATIDRYPTGKYIFLKPETMGMYGSLAVRGGGILREDLLEFWTRAIMENGLEINEHESCKTVKKADDGDYFIVQTEKTWEKEMMTYRAGRVVIAIGQAGMPMRLKVPGEDLRIERAGLSDYKVKYRLSNPEDYKGRKIMVVGAGNAAVEAAVDLIARRHGDKIEFRPPDEINEVTLIIRSDLTTDLKFVNKMQVYDCIDEGKIKVFFDTAIKEIREDEVVLMNLSTREEWVRIANDYIFALIGGERPTKFLESIGIGIS